MRVAVVQSNYIPWRGYFDLIQEVDTFVHYDEVKYTKNDWRNRNLIYAKSGLHYLTIPIAADAVKLRISQVKMLNSSWQSKHAKTLQQCYARAPYAWQIEQFIDEVLCARNWTSLSELNCDSIVYLSRALGLNTKFVHAREYTVEGNRTDRLLGLLSQIGAHTYLSGPSARDYLQPAEPAFRESGIAIKYHDYGGYPPYQQVRQPFEPYVSILDMLAHLSYTEAAWHIWGWRSQDQTLPQVACNHLSVGINDQRYTP